jgi:hypothetical protein
VLYPLSQNTGEQMLHCGVVLFTSDPVPFVNASCIRWDLPACLAAMEVMACDGRSHAHQLALVWQATCSAESHASLAWLRCGAAVPCSCWSLERHSGCCSVFIGWPVHWQGCQCACNAATEAVLPSMAALQRFGATMWTASIVSYSPQELLQELPCFALQRPVMNASPVQLCSTNHDVKQQTP